MLSPNQPAAAPSSVSFLPATSPAPAASPDGATAAPPSSGGEFKVTGHDTEVANETSNKTEITKNLEAHLNSVPDDQKQFLAEHLTPEFVRAIGIINGPEVAEYLSQYVDESKVLVPVPRELAQKYLAEQQAQAQGGQPQGQPMPPQGQPQAAPAGAPQMAPQPPAGPPQGMMAPPR